MRVSWGERSVHRAAAAIAQPVRAHVFGLAVVSRPRALRSTLRLILERTHLDIEDDGQIYFVNYRPYTRQIPPSTSRQFHCLS